jgi:hypothetical protein
MTSPSFAPQSPQNGRVSLARIDATVSALLGLTRGLGNSQPACFNRQVAMYVAARIGRWSTTVIGRFYDGRDHSTVCHAIQQIEALRETNPEVDVLLTDLKGRLQADDRSAVFQDSPLPSSVVRPKPSDIEVEKLAHAIAERVFVLIEDRLRRSGNGTIVQP